MLRNQKERYQYLAGGRGGKWGGEKKKEHNKKEKAMPSEAR